MKKKTVKILLVCLALLLSGVLILLSLRNDKVDESMSVVDVVRIKHEGTFHERGVLQSSATLPVELGSSGEILEFVSSGDEVKKGDVVVRVDTAEQDEKLQELAFNFEQQELEYKIQLAEREAVAVTYNNQLAIISNKLTMARMEAEILQRGLSADEKRLLEIARELNELNLADARDALERQIRLLEKDFVSELSVDPKRRKVTSAEAALLESNTKIRIRTRPPKEDELVEVLTRIERFEGDLSRSERAMARKLDKVDAQCQKAKSQLDKQRHEMDELRDESACATTYAPISGIVKVRMYRRWRGGRGWHEYKPGVSGNRFDKVADIVKPGEMSILVLVNESDVRRLKEGLKVRVKVPAIGSEVFEGELVSLGGVGQDRASLAPRGTESGGAGVSVFRAAIELKVSDVRFHPGMSADVEFIVDPEREYTAIPVDAVIREDGTNRVDLVSVEGVTERRDIKGFGLDNYWFAVESGIEEGDRVRLSRYVSGEGL